MSDCIDTAAERDELVARLKTIGLPTAQNAADQIERDGREIKRLLAALDAKDAEISRLEVKCDRRGKWIDSLRLAVDAKDAENERLRKCLHWYAEQCAEYRDAHDTDLTCHNVFYWDAGKRARAALNPEGET